MKISERIMKCGKKLKLIGMLNINILKKEL